MLQFFLKTKTAIHHLKSRNLGRNLFSNVAACCTLKGVSLLSSPWWVADIKLLSANCCFAVTIMPAPISVISKRCVESLPLSQKNKRSSPSEWLRQCLDQVWSYSMKFQNLKVRCVKILRSGGQIWHCGSQLLNVPLAKLVGELRWPACTNLESLIYLVHRFSSGRKVTLSTKHSVWREDFPDELGSKCRGAGWLIFLLLKYTVHRHHFVDRKTQILLSYQEYALF